MGVTVVGLRVFTHSCCRFRYRPSLLPGAVKFRRSESIHHDGKVHFSFIKTLLLLLPLPFSKRVYGITSHITLCACVGLIFNFIGRIRLSHTTEISKPDKYYYNNALTE